MTKILSFIGTVLLALAVVVIMTPVYLVATIVKRIWK